ncbi:MFS transporter [Streptomyces sp. NPDC059070]|uniref:MFS transporter n=1 Tax=Streptomyces sp. NPDC059070 TaxID=3346713 RepID=UPI0036AE95C0
MTTATTSSATTPGTTARRRPRGGWAAVLSVMAGIFAIVTTEILPIGLLSPIAADFGVSDGTAGLMMTTPALLAAVSAPVVTLATARTDRRVLLCGLVSLLAVADFLAAAAPVYWLVLVSRVLVGVTVGGFWSIGAGLAARLVPARSAARATAVIFAAVPLGSVLGVPVGTLIGDRAGWRTAFLVMGALSVAVLAALLYVLPPLPAVRTVRADTLRALLGGGATRRVLVITFLTVLAQFGAYTYVTPFLERVTDVGPGAVTALLLLYGAAGIAGNFLGGALVPRHPRAGFGGATALIGCATLLLPLLGGSTAGAVVLLLVWGIGYGAVPVASQTWFVRSAPHESEAATVLFTSSFQATMSVGSLGGGLLVDRSSPSAVMALGGAVAVLATLVIVSTGVRGAGAKRTR